MLRDQVIGALAIEGGPGPLTPDEIALVESIASETAIALENARLLEETQRRALREHQVTEITGRLRLSNHPQDILRTAIHELRQALSASAVRFKQLPDEVRPETRPEDRHDVQLENDE